MRIVLYLLSYLLGTSYAILRTLPTLYTLFISLEHEQAL